MIVFNCMHIVSVTRFLSHCLDEVLDLADAVMVLRNGASVATLPRGDLNVRDLLALMSPPAAAKLEGAHG